MYAPFYLGYFFKKGTPTLMKTTPFQNKFNMAFSLIVNNGIFQNPIFVFYVEFYYKLVVLKLEMGGACHLLGVAPK